MVELLADGRLGGAALDVFADEPRVPEALFGCPTSSYRRTRARPPRRPARRWAIWWSRNLAAHFAGDPLLTPVA